jgi:hypothetical protein
MNQIELVELNDEDKKRFIKHIQTHSVSCNFDGQQLKVHSGQGKSVQLVVYHSLILFKAQKLHYSEVEAKNSRYLAKMQEQQEYIASLQDTAEKLKDKLQALCGVNFGENTIDNCPLQNAISYDIQTLKTYMEEREAFYQEWKKRRDSIDIKVQISPTEITQSMLSGIEEAIKAKVKDLVNCEIGHTG